MVCGISIWLCPESPRWLVQKGKIEKAKRALLRVREENEVEEEIEAVRFHRIDIFWVDLDNICFVVDPNRHQVGTREYF